MRGYNPRLKWGSRGVEFVFDLDTRRFAVGRPKKGFGFGSPHQTLAHWINPDFRSDRVLGGMFTRGSQGEIRTIEHSGHFGGNWTDQRRAELVEFLQSATEQYVNHAAWKAKAKE